MPTDKRVVIAIDSNGVKFINTGEWMRGNWKRLMNKGTHHWEYPDKRDSIEITDEQPIIGY